jgi:hypothetical protein
MTAAPGAFERTQSAPSGNHVVRTLSHVGLLDGQSQLFVRYNARIAFRDKLLGGVPKDPRLIEAWLRARAGLDDGDELRQAVLRTVAELGESPASNGDHDDPVRASEQLAVRRVTTGFKVAEEGLYLEARQVKALLKECTNILFGGERWGPTRKGPKSYLAERVFVEPERLYLGITQPAGLELIVGHHTGPAGPHSTLGYHEYVLRPELDFSVLVLRDVITPAQWADVWVLAQQIGLGAVRSQGYGRFRLVAWQSQT